MAALAVLSLSGCYDETPSTPEAPNSLQFLRAAHVRDIATALNQAFDEFERRNYDACLAFCAYVLSREPEYCVPVEFEEDLLKVKEREEYFEFLMPKVWNWKKLTASDGEGSVPYQETLTYPHLPLPKELPPVSAHMTRIHHGWPPDLAKQLQEELGTEYPNLLIFGEWRMRQVCFLFLDDSLLLMEDIKRIEKRIRELDRPTGPSAAPSSWSIAPAGTPPGPSFPPR